MKKIITILVIGLSVMGLSNLLAQMVISDDMKQYSEELGQNVEVVFADQIMEVIKKQNDDYDYKLLREYAESLAKKICYGLDPSSDEDAKAAFLAFIARPPDDGIKMGTSDTGNLSISWYATNVFLNYRYASIKCSAEKETLKDPWKIYTQIAYKD